MNKNPQSTKLTIIGAGPTGCLLAIMLARRGFNVEIFERRPDPRSSSLSASPSSKDSGRSINLAISCRGVSAMEDVGLGAEIKKLSIPMVGRMIHAKEIDRPLIFQAYGKNSQQTLGAIGRRDLNILLLQKALDFPQVKIFFSHRLLDVDFTKMEIIVEDSSIVGPSPRHLHLPFHRLFGTDGSASQMRQGLLQAHKDSHSPTSSYSKEDLDYGYKELVIPPSPDNKYTLDKNALHIWPRHSFMLIALPNLDKSFTGTLFLDQKTISHLENNPSAIIPFFQEQFPDAIKLMPHLQQEFLQHPMGNLSTIKCSPWSWQGKALLLGDAAHAIVPFYGQGMNCCFEDCLDFDELLIAINPNNNSEEDWEKLFLQFFHQRRPNTDAIAAMALNNFIEMRDKTADPHFLLQKKIESYLMNTYPTEYSSQYQLVTFSRTPYSTAWALGKLQEQMFTELLQRHPQLMTASPPNNGQWSPDQYQGVIEQFIKDYHHQRSAL